MDIETSSNGPINNVPSQQRRNTTPIKRPTPPPLNPNYMVNSNGSHNIQSLPTLSSTISIINTTNEAKCEDFMMDTDMEIVPQCSTTSI